MNFPALPKAVLALVLFFAPLEVFAAKCGLTILTHGYQKEGFGPSRQEPPQWVHTMAQSIREQGDDNIPIYVVRFDSANNRVVLDWEVTYNAGTDDFDRTVPSYIDIERSGAAIIILNWVLESNNFNDYSTKVIGDRFFDYLFGQGHHGHNLAELPIHLIGHSRGASLNTRIALDLASNGINVMQVTSLDAHPVGGTGDDEKMATYGNTIFADSYFRDSTGDVPFGVSVPGAYNVNLSPFMKVSGIGKAHSYVHAYYHGTIDTQISSDHGEITILTTDWFTNAGKFRDSTGYAYSRYTGPRVAPPASGLSALMGGNRTGARTLVAATSQYWPNAFFDQDALDWTRAVEGQSVSIPYHFSDRNSSQTVTFAIDTDTNPFNNTGSSYQEIGSVTQNARTAGSIGTSTFSWTPTAAQKGTRYLQVKTTNNRNDGISRVRYDYYLRPVTVDALPVMTPTITSITPRTLPTLPAGQRQWIAIAGKDFSASSTLLFNDGVQDYPSDSTYLEYQSPTAIRYNIAVGLQPATWTVKVINGGSASPAYTFFTVSTGTQLTGLSISGPGAVVENGSASYTATALFSDGSAQSGVAATWSESSSATSISSSGQLSAGSVSGDTAVTVSASYTYGGVTKSANTSVTVLNGGSGGGSTSTEVLANGSFEGGDTPWGTPNGNGDVVNLSYPHNGSWYAYIGNANNAAGAFSQFFPIPASATSATLSFYLNVVTAETTSTTKFDKMDVSLATAGDQYVGTIASFSNLDKGTNTNGAYTLKSYNIMPLLNAYKGQSLYLVFSGTTDSSSSTIFRVDDVSLRITTPNPVTLTGLSIAGPTSILEGHLEGYYGQALFSDGSTQTISASSWTENSSATSIDGNGFLTAGQVSGDTSVTISASYTFNGVTKQATKQVTVVDSSPVVTFTSLAINGPGALNENSSQAYTATAIFSNGTTQTVSPSWSENSAASSVSASGVLAAAEVNSDTTVTLSASYTINGVTRNAGLDVLIINSLAQPSLSSLSILGSSTAGENSTAQFTARATFSDGSTQEVDPVWSENSAVTTVSTFGLLSAGNVTANTDITLTASYTLRGVTRSDTRTVTITDTPDNTGPTLFISIPEANAIVNSATLTVSGNASDGARGNNGISSVTVNGVNASNATATGSNVANWSAQIALAAGANTITVVARDSFNNSTQQQIAVSFEQPDVQAPALVIDQPLNGATSNVSTITVSGTATDSAFGDHGIASIKVNGAVAAGGSASGADIAHWSAQVSLKPGLNAITVVANDASGNNRGTTQKISVTYVPAGAIALSAGTYTATNGGASLMVRVLRTGGTGGDVSATVSTSPGTALDGIDYVGGEQTVQLASGVTSGSVSIPLLHNTQSTGPKYFTVTLSSPAGGASLGTRTVATATLLDDGQFPFAAASYTGLLNREFGAPGYGIVALRTSATGMVTGKVLADGRTYVFSGKLTGAGAFAKAFAYRVGTRMVSPVLTLQIGNDGTLSGLWDTGVGAIYAIAGEQDARGTAQQPIAQAGRYTAHLRGEDITPGGGPVRGYLLATVSYSGAVALSGALPDGTKLSSGSHVTVSGSIPAAFGLYPAGKGCLFGLTSIVGSGRERVFAGDLVWSKPPQAAGIYASGLAGANLELLGHIWTPPVGGTRLVPDFDANGGLMLVTLNGGGLNASIGKRVSLTTRNAVVASPKTAEDLRMAVSPTSGAFAGTFRHSDGKAKVIRGAFVQNHAGPAVGEGFFTGATSPGLVGISVPPSAAFFSISVASAGHGTVAGGNPSIPDGTLTTVTAIPDADYRFVHWTEAGVVVSTNAVFQFAVGQNRTLLATFEHNSSASVLLQDNFDDNTLDSGKWIVANHGDTRVAEEGGMMKVETTQTDAPGTLKTQVLTVPMERPWTLTRRVLLHRETPISFQGGTKFFVGYARFFIDQVPQFAVNYCDYDYAGDAPRGLPTHGFVLSRNGAGGTANPNTGDVTPELMPLILDQWFNEKVTYDPTSGVMSYFINGNLLSQLNVGRPPDSTPRGMQIEFQAYGWWTTHRQHFDDFSLVSGN